MKRTWTLLVLLYLIAVVVIIMLAFSRALSLPVLIAAAVLLFSIPFLREFVPRNHVDERQVQISRFSSSMAFYAYLALLLIIVIKDYLSLNKAPGDAFLGLLVIPLAVKMFVSVLQNFEVKQAARCIASFFAALWLIFVVLSHGLSLMTLIEALPFLVLVGLTWSIKKWPKLCGVLFILLGVASLVTVVAMQKNFYGGLLIFSVMSLPLILCGIALLVPKEKMEHV
jgi:hypothetical protein